MPTDANLLPSWNDSRDALVDHLTSATDLKNGEAYSGDPASVYQRAAAEIARIDGELQRLAAVGLQQIDDAIAAGDLVSQLNGLAAQARQEAEHLMNIAKTIEQVAGAVDQVVGIVDKIVALPFL